jgi:nitrate reductase alpha subunit
MGGFVRSTWDEVNEIIAAANVYTIKKYGPDRVIGFSPIPAMSMVSYAAGSRYLSLIGGVCMSFYDWYCDLPPASPQVWGEQTDVPESADWYNSTFIIAWGSNVPQTRTPDAHFFTEVHYKGAKIVAVTPDYAEVSKLADLWLHPKQGTDSALAMAMGHVILREFHLDRKSDYFGEYVRRYTDMPMLVKLVKRGEQLVADRFVRASDFSDSLGHANNPDWKTLAYDEFSGDVVAPNGSIGFRWNQQEGEDQGKWNTEEKDGKTSRDVKLRLSLIDSRDDVAPVAFPYFGGIVNERFEHSDMGTDVLVRNVAVKKLQLAEGEAMVATVFDLLCANYGLDRGLGGANVATSFEDNVPYTPKWQESITGVKADDVITVARQFADNADKTNEPLVSLRHELPRGHQYADDVRLRRPVRRRLGALCRPGKTAPADRVASLGVRTRLASAATPAEFDLVFLCAHGSVALRKVVSRRDYFASGRPQGVPGQPDRFQHPVRTHGLAAIRAATADQSDPGVQGRRGCGHGPKRLCGQVAQGRDTEDGVRGSR